MWHPQEVHTSPYSLMPLKKKLWLLFSFDREQTHWQSQIPRAPWGGQSKKIYEWEDERCAVEGGGNPCSNQEHPWMTVSGKGRKQQHPRLPLPIKTTTVRKHSVSPAVSTMTQWIIQFTDYGLIRDRFWASSLFLSAATQITGCNHIDNQHKKSDMVSLHIQRRSL